MTVLDSIVLIVHNSYISQIGYFFDFHPRIAGPIILGLGISLIVIWYIYGVVLGRYQEELARSERVTLTGIIVIGSFLTATGFIVRGKAVWFYALMMFALGRGVEGAIFVRYMQKIVGYLGQAWEFATRSKRSGGGDSSALRGFLRRRLQRFGYHASLTVVAVIASLGGFVGATSLEFSVFSAVTLMWTLFVATSSIGTLLWDLRYTTPTVPMVPLLGLLFCIVGTEVYAFSVPQPFRDILQPYLTQPSLVIPALNPMDFFILAIGQLTFISGVLFALLVLQTNDKTMIP
jgi:hypothetical protein